MQQHNSRKRPTITNMMCQTLNGFIAWPQADNDQQRMDSGFGCEEDRALLIQEIKAADAVVCGRETAHQTGGIIDCGTPHQPTWYVLSRSQTAPQPWQTPNHPPVVQVIADPSPHSRGVQANTLVFHPHSLARDLVAHLALKEQYKVLLLGGGQINTLFYQENLVDLVKITIAPLVIWNPAATPLINNTHSSASGHHQLRLELQTMRSVQDHLFLEYRVKK